MKRAPFVIGATGVGLGLLLSFHTKPVHVSIVSSAPTSGSESSGAQSSATTTPTTATPATTAPSADTTSRSATGQDVQYRYGEIELKVTEKGSRITDIQVVADQASDPRSEEINSQAIPLLQEQAMSVQSANVDGVSGATFTSEAYAQALQSALDQLK